MAEERIAPARVSVQAFPARPSVRPQGAAGSIGAAGSGDGGSAYRLDLPSLEWPASIGPGAVPEAEDGHVVVHAASRDDAEQATATDAWRFALGQMHRATPSCAGASAEHGTWYEPPPMQVAADERFSLWHPGLGGIDVHSYHDVEGWKILLRCDDERTHVQLAQVLPADADQGRLTLHVERMPRRLPEPRDVGTSGGY